LTPWSMREDVFKGSLLIYTEHGEIVRCVTSDQFKNLMIMLTHHTPYRFKQLVDMTAVDYPSREHRFEVVYMLLSVDYSMRCRVKVLLKDGEAIDSVCDRYPSANWAERECFDMFGIPFEGHPDLRRILTDYGFEGHPLRKDFPLTGYSEVRYDEESKRVVSEPLERSQDFRAYDFRMSWKSLPTRGMVKAN
jgi:NADH/F420H2 dehydrogenase subunit C